MKKVLVLLLTLGLTLPAVAGDSDWTEITLTAFDQINGEFEPHMSAAVVNFIGGKGIGAFLGEDNAIGPLTMWRVWQRPLGDTRLSIYLVASSDVSDVAQSGLFANGTFGIEPRFYWTEFVNAEIGLGILSTTFREGEKAVWTPYIKVAFRT